MIHLSRHIGFQYVMYFVCYIYFMILWQLNCYFFLTHLWPVSLVHWLSHVLMVFYLKNKSLAWVGCPWKYRVLGSPNIPAKLNGLDCWSLLLWLLRFGTIRNRVIRLRWSRIRLAVLILQAVAAGFTGGPGWPSVSAVHLSITDSYTVCCIIHDMVHQ